MAEMNRVRLVIDMSHSAERNTLEAIERSTRPIAITRANRGWQHPAIRNKSDMVFRALSKSGGMLGFSLYPHHLKDGSACGLRDFCKMVAEAAERYGAEAMGMGSDLCQDQPDSVVPWIRAWRWTKDVDHGDGSAERPGFPPMPDWFRDNRDWDAIRDGLRATGFSRTETGGIPGANWLRFDDASFGAG